MAQSLFVHRVSFGGQEAGRGLHRAQVCFHNGGITPLIPKGLSLKVATPSHTPVAAIVGLLTAGHSLRGTERWFKSSLPFVPFAVNDAATN